MTQRSFLTAALLTAALLSAGCDASAFTRINSAFQQVKTVSTVGATATLPAAAYATSLSVVQVMNAFNSHANGVNASGANVVAAGGANVVAPGGANVIAPGGGNPTFAPAFGVLDDAMHAPAFDLSNPQHSTLTVTQADGSAEMDATFAYSQSSTGNSTTYTLNSFDAHVSGFHIVCTGTFNYTAGSNQTGHMNATLNGSAWEWLKDPKNPSQMANTGDELKTTLSFNCPVPLSGNVPNIGSISLSDDAAGMSMNATANMSNSVLQASGSVKTPTGTSTVTVTNSGVKTSSDAGATTGATASGTAQ